MSAEPRYNLRGRKPSSPGQSSEPDPPTRKVTSPRSKSAPRRDPSYDAPPPEKLSKINVDVKSDETKGSGKFEKMIRRSFFAVIMMTTFAGIIWTGHMAVISFVILLQTMLFYELISIRHEKKLVDDIPLFRTLHWAGYVISIFFTYGRDLMLYVGLDWAAKYHFYLVFCMYVPFFLAFVLSCAFSGEGKSKETKSKLLKYMFGQLSWVLLILFVVVFQMRFAFHNILEGLFWFLLPTALVICNDTAAYFVGFTFGRKFIDRPLTSLSPNKTWEGFLGGMVVTLAFGWILAGELGKYEYLTCPHRHIQDRVAECRVNAVFVERTYHVMPEVVSLLQMLGIQVASSFQLVPVKLHALLLAFFASVFAPFGGFFASALKRAYRVSDFGSLIPGHGGVMDRMDCQLIMLFCTHVHYSTFVREIELTFETVWPTVLNLSPDDQQLMYGKLAEVLQNS